MRVRSRMLIAETEDDISGAEKGFFVKYNDNMGKR